jgi:small redox-active disulfide protein 2
MKIQVLGTGCSKCRILHELVQQAALATNIEAEIEKIEDMQRILSFDVLMLPALVIDGEVRIAGRLPKLDEVKTLLIERFKESYGKVI